MEDKDRYAIGQQDFNTLRRDDALYVDKTAFVEKIVKSKTKYYFLACPRRFGIYIIELKYDSSPELALRQIEEKGFARRFAVDPRQFFKIGVNFSSESRRIESWKTEA